MITKKDYENLIIYFSNNTVPENFKNFVEKLKVMKEELDYREEIRNKIDELHKRLEELSNNDIEG